MKTVRYRVNYGEQVADPRRKVFSRVWKGDTGESTGMKGSHILAKDISKNPDLP